MLAEFRDFLKSLDVATNYSIGKIDNAKMYSLGVYTATNLEPVVAIGKESKYDIAGVRILLHWNKNARETEAAARNLYEKIRYITNTDMGDVHVDYLRLDDGEPTFIGSDDNGVYEYHISARIYYRR